MITTLITSPILDFARDELHLTLTPAQAEMLGSFYDGGASMAVWQCGRRGGKSLLADVLALADVALRDHLRRFMRPGETRISAIIAPRQEQATAHIRNIRSLVDQSPALSALLTSETATELTFANGSAVIAYPCSARSIRGGAWSSVILDEFGHFVTTEDGPAASERVLEAATPALAQFGALGWQIAVSTPLWRQGAFHKLVERASSGRWDHIHYRHLSTGAMNPAIDAAWLEIQRQSDPEMYSREYLAEFVDGISSYLNSSDVLACARHDGRKVLPPRAETVYEAALDVAFSNDRTALCIAHREDELTIVDGVWTWHRAGFEATLTEVAAVAKSYRVSSLRIDQFSEAAVRESLARLGLSAQYEPWTNATKADAFGHLKAAINTASIELPDDQALVEELVGLEARPTPSGLTRIAASGSGHDDRATALASVVAALVAPGATWIDYMILTSEDDRAAPVTSNDPFDQLPF